MAMLAALGVVGCAPEYQPMGSIIQTPQLAADAVVTADGYRLPLRQWRPIDGPPRAVVIALHGFNDYSLAFADAAAMWADRGILTYAYDQRGFGATANPGIWPGSETLAHDLATVVGLVRARHAGSALFIVGESMGAAVALTALAGPRPPPADGVVLVAPAVWGRMDMSLVERLALWWAVTVTPGLTLTGQGLDIVPSDNIDMLRALGRDPLVIKETRSDAIGGLVDLMEAAAAAPPAIDRPMLVLYGDREEIIPVEAIARFVDTLPPDQTVIAIYPDGYHMLLRDLAAAVVIDDVAHWITEGDSDLPSGYENRRPPLISATGS